MRLRLAASGEKRDKRMSVEGGLRDAAAHARMAGRRNGEELIPSEFDRSDQLVPPASVRSP